MLKKFIKEIFKTAVVSTIFGFPFRADTTQTLKQFFTSQLQFYTAITTLSYISAKSSGDTANRNLGIKRAVTNPIAPRNIVYGKTRVGGTIVQRTLTAKSASTKNVLHQVIALAGHEINNITKIYIDAGKGIKELDLSDSNDFVSATENSTTVFRCVDPEFANSDNDEAYTGGSLIKLAFEKGDQTTANGYAVAQMSSASAWSTDHKMLGIAYIYINCIYDTEKFTQIPSFSFEIEGKKVFDPVSSSTVYSTNPALIIRDYLMDSTYGFGATATEINDAVTGAGFVKARSDCNDSVSITSGTESRYTLNGQFTSTEEPQTVLETMLSACAGQLLYNNGVFSLFVGKERTASGTITDDKILEPIQIQTKFSGRELANGVKATYVRPSDEYIAAEITPYKDSTYLTQDTPSGKAQADYENFLNLSFPYTQSSFTAQRLARIALDYQRQNQTLSVLVPLEFLSHQVGDIVNLDNDRLGYSGKDFEIVGMTFEFVGEQYLALRLSLKEYSTTVFNNITYVADPTLPSPPDSGDNTVSSPTGLALAEFTKDSQVRLHFIRASWTNNLDDKIVTTEVAYKKSTDSNFDAADVSYPSNSFSFYVEPATTYNVKVRHISNTGVSSAYTGTVNLTTSGGQVTLTTGTVAGITIESGKLYQGTGTFNNSNTGFFVDSSGQFSLKDKLSFNGTTLNISGNLTVENTISANKIVVDGINLDNLISASTQAGSIYLTEFTGIKIATAGATSGYPALLRIQDLQGTNTFTDITQSQTGINIRARANTTKGTITFQGIGSGITPSTYASFDAAGDMAFNNNVTISGNLTVSGTTTTIDTTNLDVKDKNITLNFGSGDTSSNADGAGITIQDAVSASTDATLLWDSTNDKFDFSHSIQVPDNANVKVGSDGDLFMVHNGSNSFIQNKVGDFYIENASDDKDIFFRSDDGSGGLATYMTIDGSHSRMTIAKNTLLFDNVELRIGDNSGAGDLKIYHNGTHSILENSTGDLILMNNADDKDILFQSDNGAGGVQTYFFLDGSAEQVVFEKSAKFTDNDKAIFGTGNDLEIYHDGSHSYIQSSGSGSLVVEGGGSTGDLSLRATDDADIKVQNGELAARFIGNGAVELYHNNSKKFETTSTGIDVTGTATVDVLTSSGAIRTTGGSIQIDNGDFIANRTGNDFSFVQSATADSSSRGFIFQKSGGGNIAGLFVVKSAQALRSNNGYAVDSTTVIDSSRNLTNIGTISSGTITTSGDIAKTSGDLLVDVAGDIRLDADGGDIKFADGGTVISLLSMANSDTTISTNVSDKDIIFKGFDGGSAITALTLDMSAGGNARFSGDISLTGSIQNTVVPAEASVKINENGYNDGTTYFRDLDIFDGKGNQFVKFDGSTQRVGIGTTAPDVKLRVDHDDNTVAFKVTGGGGGANIAEFVRDVGTSGVSVSVNGSSARPQIKFVKPSNTFAIGVNSSSFEIADNDVLGTNTRLSIDSSGNLGLGTSSPSRPLHVKNSDDVVAFFECTDATSVIHIKDQNTGVSIGSDSSGNGIFSADIDSVGSKNILFKLAGSEKVRLTSSGNLGVGTTSPATKLEVAGNITLPSDGQIKFRGTNHYPRIFASSNDLLINLDDGSGTNFTAFKIDNATGNISIGNTSAAAKLDIRQDSGYAIRAENASGHYFRVNSTGAVEVAGSEVITASRNLTNIGTISSGAITSSSTITSQANSAAAGIRIRRTNSAASGARGHIAFMDSDSKVVSSIHSVATGSNNSGDLRFSTSTGESRTNVYDLTPVLTLGTDNNATFAGTVSAFGNSDTVAGLEIYSDANHGLRILHRATEGDFSFERRVGGTNTEFLRIGRANGNATFAGTISSGAITSTGQVNADELVVQNDSTFNGGIDIDGDATFGDNNKAIFGAGSDLQIYHDGNHSYIQDSGTGRLRFQASTQIDFLNGAGTETLANFIENDAIKLYFNNALKLATTSTGVDVTGGITTSGLLTVGSGAGAIKINESFITARSSDNANDINLIANINVLDADDVVIGSTSGQRFNDNIVFRTGGANRVTIDSSGRVGIGTSSPSKKLHVQNGSSGYSGSYNSRTAAIIEGSASNGTVLSIMAPNTGYSGIFFGDQDGESVGQIHYDHPTNALRFATSGTEKVRIDTSGRLGIGTTSPSQKLDVAGIIQSTSTNPQVRINTSSGTGAGYLVFGDSGDDDRGWISYLHASDALQFRVNASERLRIDSSGNVGIGTTSPQTGLQVQKDWVNDYGSINISHSQNTLGGLGLRANNVYKGGLIYRDGTQGTFWELTAYQNEPILFKTNNAERVRVANSGSVGIATTSPSASYKLDVNGKIRSQQEILINTGSLFVNQEGEGIHILSPNGTEYKLTVSNAGALVITEQ